MSGAIDLGKLFDLARAFMAIKWDLWCLDERPRATHSSEQAEEAWLALSFSLSALAAR